MPAKNGYLMTMERFAGSSWTEVIDFFGLTIDMQGNPIDVTTHRHVDANDVLHKRYITGPVDYNISGSGIAHAGSTSWVRNWFSGDTTNGELLRIYCPNLW